MKRKKVKNFDIAMEALNNKIKPLINNGIMSADEINEKLGYEAVDISEKNIGISTDDKTIDDIMTKLPDVCMFCNGTGIKQGGKSNEAR